MLVVDVSVGVPMVYSKLAGPTDVSRSIRGMVLCKVLRDGCRGGSVPVGPQMQTKDLKLDAVVMAVMAQWPNHCRIFSFPTTARSLPCDVKKTA
jgi:hypothetical protein